MLLIPARREGKFHPEGAISSVLTLLLVDEVACRAFGWAVSVTSLLNEMLRVLYCCY
jgi:hypothetical protein